MPDEKPDNHTNCESQEERQVHRRLTEVEACEDVSEQRKLTACLEVTEEGDMVPEGSGR